MKKSEIKPLKPWQKKQNQKWDDLLKQHLDPLIRAAQREVNWAGKYHDWEHQRRFRKAILQLEGFRIDALDAKFPTEKETLMYRLYEYK